MTNSLPPERPATLLAEIERLRPHYQGGSIKDHARRQMLDHFEKLAHEGKAGLPDATEALTVMITTLREALAEVVEDIDPFLNGIGNDRLAEIRKLAGLDANG